MSYRVKVYKLNETGGWDDKGTGLVSVEPLQVRLKRLLDRRFKASGDGRCANPRPRPFRTDAHSTSSRQRPRGDRRGGGSPSFTGAPHLYGGHLPQTRGCVAAHVHRTPCNAWGRGVGRRLLAAPLAATGQGCCAEYRMLYQSASWSAACSQWVDCVSALAVLLASGPVSRALGMSARALQMTRS
jgi:hypothetical protein